jgi:hypothetical protein
MLDDGSTIPGDSKDCSQGSYPTMSRTGTSTPMGVGSGFNSPRREGSPQRPSKPSSFHMHHHTSLDIDDYFVSLLLMHKQNIIADTLRPVLEI